MQARIIGLPIELLAVGRSEMSSCTGFEMKTTHLEENFDAIVFGVVDETLKQIFKEVGIKVIYDFFEKNACLRREEIIGKPKVFSAGLERLLGSAGPVIEKQIIRNLHGKFQLEYVEKEETEFSGSLKELRCRLYSTKRKWSSRKMAKNTYPAIEACRDSSGSPISKKTTEREESESALRESEEHYRNLVETAPDVIYTVCAKDGIITSLNPSFEKITGWARSEWLGKSFALLIHPDDLSIAIDAFHKTLRGDAPPPYELRVLSKSGKYLIGEFMSKPHIKRGKIVGGFGITRDATERKRTEEALRDSEERFRVISASTMDAIVLIDNRGRISYLNPAAERLFGYMKEEAVGRDACKLVIPKRFRKDVARTVGELLKARRNPSIGSCIEFVAVRKDGTEFPAEFSLSALQLKGMPYAVGIIRDITEHKQMEDVLQQDEEKYRGISKKLESLMKSSAVMLRTMNMRKRLKTIAEAVREQGWERVVISLRDENLNTTEIVTAGLTSKEESYLRKHQAPGHVWRKRLSSMFERYRLGEFYHLPWSDPLVKDQFKHALSSKVPKTETVDWNPDDLLFVPLRLPTGQVVGVMSIDDPEDGRRPTKDSLAPLELFAHQAAVAIENARLIQQLNNAKNQLEEYAEHLEEKVEERTADLKRSEEKLKSIFAASPDAITATDLDGNIVECSEQTVKMYRYSSKEELIGKNAFSLIAEKDHQKAVESLERTLKQSTKNLEYTFVTKNGREFPAELSASTVRDASGKPIGFVAVTKDITERKQMEMQLFKSERLAAIGELAAMVGHDLRNPLTGITGAAYYLRTRFGQKMDARGREMLAVIQRDIEYSNKIINDLLEYSRETRLELKETNLEVIVEGALSIAKVPRNVQVVNLTKKDSKIMVDAERMKRTFVNIIRNAFDAMPKGGTLTIKSRRSKNDLEITFADTGVGMVEDMIEKVFTPLFTTKAKGMGFGLPICRRFVEAHGGRISVESKVGRGTAFMITIPVKPKNEGGEKVWVNVPESLLSTTTRA